WEHRFFLAESDYLVPQGNIPTKVPTAMNYKKAGRLMICLVGGGVTINARSVLRQTEFVTMRDDSLTERKQSVQRGEGDLKSRWWWD
ncbi:MAG: hypothetical protein RLO18_00280, partial [Gimesia chilikensis]